MAINHENINDPYIHEPKGASSAAAGHVYEADGLGSGSWKFPELEGQTSAIEGETPVKESGSLVWKTTPATSPAYAEIDKAFSSQTLTVSTPTVLTGFTFEDYVPSKFSLAGTSTLTVNEAGIYFVSYRAIFKPDTNLSTTNEVITISLRKNGLVDVPFRETEVTILRNAEAGDPFSISNGRIMDLADGDELDIQAEAEDTTRAYSILASLQLFKIANT